MSDNIRPALYQAKYEAVSANRIGEHHDKTVSIAGKCCESGDMLIWDIDRSISQMSISPLSQHLPAMDTVLS